MGSFLRGNLMQNESVIREARPHWISLLIPFLTIFFFIGIIFFPIALIIYLTTEIGVTSKRLMVKSGFIARRSEEIPLDKIDAINIEQNVLERFVLAGKLTISTGGERIRTVSIWRPRDFRNDIMQAQENYKQSLYK